MEDWFDEFAGMANIINRFAGIPLDELRGTRVPFLRVGWNTQFIMVSQTLQFKPKTFTNLPRRTDERVWLPLRFQYGCSTIRPAIVAIHSGLSYPAQVPRLSATVSISILQRNVGNDHESFRY